ncbi:MULTISPECIES: DNA adenine methylase [Metabacillus]|uniref:DNA adenine methylase n=1 Tax=Metabacillus TaxID=2675233 RepID=UPI000C8003B4|nr:MULTISPECIES: DNA adenine methylase [Metabacillus]MCM3443976.1 DNA adenine methylase [Metabacillus halosaccharovorans]PMC34969.1 DNA methyltransferase [Bacillus sp. UMB0899]
MFNCQFCGLVDNCYIQLDKYKRGFWCEICDGYSYLEADSEKHRFTLILEDKYREKKSYNPPAVKLSKRLSPYRYPGGKSKIINFLFMHLREAKTSELISPFTGGGSFELAMLDAGVVEKLHLNDIDTGVYSLWWVLKHMPYVLIDRIKSIQPNHKDYFNAQSIIKSDYIGVDLIEAAWSSLLVNRLAYSGVAKANPLGGKNGKTHDLLSRWNPVELIRRIEKIHSMSDRIEITRENAVELIEESYWNDTATIFIDPPYVIKGKDLYHCYYTEKDHIELSFLLDTLHFGFPGADILVTYDYNDLINNIYTYPDKEIIGRTYSA